MNEDGVIEYSSISADDWRKLNMGTLAGEVGQRETQFVCSIPAELGAVTQLRRVGGREVIETESGITMIVP